MPPNVALVFGASGISGWAVTRNLLSYPSSTTFSRVIAVTNRPRRKEEMRLPDDSRIELFSVNLHGELGNVVDQLRKIHNLHEVTHMYYCAYSNVTAYTENVMGIKDLNVGMTYNAVHATSTLCPQLQFVTLQTGTNNYGVAVFTHQDKIEINPPLKEDNPRIPSPYGDEIFYYPQVDLIKAAAEGKAWKWCEIRPDQISGFVPNPTGMVATEPIALYLALYRYVYGAGATVSFPGSYKNYTYTTTDSSQDLIARAHIHLSVVKPDDANGEAFNIADSPTPVSWKTMWPVLTRYFGLKGTGPENDGWGDIDVWWNAHQKEYNEMCVQHRLIQRVIPAECWVYLRAGFVLLERNRAMSLDKIRGVGFTEERSVGQGHVIGFEHMADAGLIPVQKGGPKL